MKKILSLVLLLVLVASVITAAIPTKMVKLTIINKSGYPVYIKLDGSELTDASYYLTIPTGTRDEPITELFTVMSDVYDRVTWQCDGLSNTGKLVMDGNTRLTFLPCEEFQCSVGYYDPKAGWVTGCNNDIFVTPWVTHYTQGEPRMEKVTYWLYNSSEIPKAGSQHDGYWNYSGKTIAWDVKTYKLPVGLSFRYQY